MADISKITLPSGTTYNIKDEVARQSASVGFNICVSTNAGNTPKDVSWKSGETTIVGTLAASTNTKGAFYLVPSASSKEGDKDIYDEYVTVENGGAYSWEKLGNTQFNIGDLGSLAYKDSASGSYTPEGSVSTPSITVEVNTVEKYVASSANGGGSVTAGSVASCTLPTMSATVSNETLTLAFTAGSFTPNTPTEVTLPTFTSQTMATSVKSASSTKPTFTGTAKNVSVS